MMATLQDELYARDVQAVARSACEFCHAIKGSRCRTPSGRAVLAHKARLDKLPARRSPVRVSWSQASHALTRPVHRESNGAPIRKGRDG